MSGGGGGGGSSRPDAAAGGSFNPAGTPRGAPSSAEPPSLAQYLSLEPLPVGGDHKHSRAAELRRALADSSAAAEPPFALAQGRPLPPAAVEELRRIRAGVAESSARAKERAKSMHESIQKLEKYQNVARRRQRSGQGGGSAERLSASVSGSLRMGAQNSGDAPVQRLEERAKSASMSKRVRSSLTADARLEGRVNVSTRQGPLLDTEKNPPLEKEKSSVRNGSATSGFSEEKLRGLAPGGEGWEKKMKRKRSVGTMLNRGSEIDRDVKPSVQHRSNSEVRGRSSDALPFRHGGASVGASGGSKMDGSSQPSISGSRYLQKTEMDSPSLPNERRERHAGLDKERVLVKGNKAHTSEDMQPGTLSPVTKSKACRAPRTSSLVGIHSSSTLLRSAGAMDEWEEAPSTNKSSPLGNTTNRKRPMAASASPPPVAWVGQRPQKMSRSRRANVVSPVSNFDDPLSEGSPIDVAVRPALETSGLLLSRGAVSNNSQAVSRMDNVTSPACLSGSEGSVATEHRSKEKVTNSGDFENEGINSAHVGTDLIFSSKKSRVPLKEELEDSSIRRQGRSGRGTMHVKGSSIPKEKLDNTETRKLVKSVRPVSEKNESKLGRPPTKKGSDRKESSAQPEILNCGSMDITGEPEDDREELLAAANAARGAIVGAYAGPFWKKIEPMLTFIRSEDLSFLKNQITFLEEIEMGMSNIRDEDKLTVSTNYNGPPSSGEHFLPASNASVLLDENEANGIGPRESVDILSYNGENHSTASQKAQGQGIFGEMAPLTSRLLSALIVEDVDDFSESNGVQGDMLLEFPNDFLPPAATVEFGATAVESSFGMCADFKHSSSNSVYNIMSNGFTASSNLRGSYSQNSVCSEHISDGINVTVYPGNGSSHGSMTHVSQKYQTPGKDLSLPLYGYQYAQMSLHDRTLVELHSIDIFPEMPELDEGEDEDINKVILELQKRLFDQVDQKKCQLNKLEKAIRNTKNMEERSLEQHAMNKLVERAYKKLLGGRGSSSHKGGLSKAASKAAKQLALAFAKRTLVRCQKFEETEKSCFREPFLWSVLSAPLPKSEVADGGTPGSADRLRNVKLDRSPLSQGSTKLKKGERERDRDGSGAKNSGSKSGRNSSGGGRSSNERKTKMKPKQKLAQLSTSGNVLGRVTEAPPPASSLLPSPSPSQEWTAAPPPSLKPVHPVQVVRNTVVAVAQEAPLDAGMDPMVDGILDVPEGNDIGAWFTEGLDDGALQDFDFSGGLEIPDDDLTQLGFM